MTDYYIFHLDDEPIYVDWIPSVIFNQIKERIDPAAKYIDEEKDGVSIVYVQFHHQTVGQIRLIYELHEGKDAFLESVGDAGSERIVLYIFDLKLLGDGDAGAEVARQILDPTAGNSLSSTSASVDWFYLTGFPEEAEAALGALNLGGRVVAKPPNSADLASDVLGVLQSRITRR